MARSLRDLYDELRLAHGAGGRAKAAGTEDPFIAKLIQLLFSYGAQIRASDIHLEPSAAGARVRYRIDGILHEMLILPEEIRDPLLRSLKIKASMATEIVGRSKPQDGRLDFETDGRTLDLRLSSLPTLFGDVLAIRLLDRSVPLLKLEQLGFPQQLLQEFERLIRRPNGMILVTGPANSGKTTTLYAALDKLRSPQIKIVTLEDPIECQMEGVDQSQITPAVGLTFTSGLRAILRQDADIIMLGEIRDTETADIAIRAALTGHVVYSTLHTRHSCGAVVRLLDMGIEPHLIVASVNGVIAQRLVRMVCSNCKAPDPSAATTFARLWTQETNAPPPELGSTQFKKGTGCPACNATGYQGRTGLFELLVLNDELKHLILDRASNQLYKTAVRSGMRTMVLHGLEKAYQGATTVEEVLRVTGETEES